MPPRAKRRRSSGAQGDGAGRVAAVVLDIEGTTTPLSFVRQTLKSVFVDRVGAFLAGAGDDADALELARAGRFAASPERCAAEAVRLVEAGGELPAALRRLQARVWKAGFEAGDVKGDVFRDVAPCLESWSRRGVRVFIYSSGAVAAQRLLFRHSVQGDLSGFVAGHFDPSMVGSKRARESYEAIAERAGAAAGDMLFVTDLAQEAVAARDAGMQAALMERPGNAPIGAEDAAAAEAIPRFRSLVDARV